MGFCWQFCCFKLCPCKGEDKTENALQEDTFPIVVQPVLRSSTTSADLGIGPEISTFFQGTRPSSALTSEDSFASYIDDTSGQDAQHQNVTTRNLKSRIPSISATLDPPRTWKPTISSSEFLTEDPWVPKSSIASSILDHPYPHRATIVDKSAKPQVHDIPVTFSQSLEPELKNVSTSLRGNKEEEEEERLAHPAFLHLGTSTKPFEASNPFPKLRVADPETHFPLDVALAPEPTTTLKPTLPYFGPSTSVKSSFAEVQVPEDSVLWTSGTCLVPLSYSTITKVAPVHTSITTTEPLVGLEQCRPHDPATPLKPVTPPDCRPQSPPPLILSAFSLLRQTSPSPLPPPVRSSPNEDLLTDLLRSFQMCHSPTLPKGTAYQLESLDPKTKNFVHNVLFRNRKFRGFYEIKAVNRVWNPYLMLHYELNQIKYGGKFTNRFMYHGTSLFAANEILKHNFNWRMVKEFNYGKGVYFANNPYFASHYGKRSADPRMEDYVMIVAKVLIEEGTIQRGFPHLVPPVGHSTTSDSKQELIKFDDCAFYPEFLVLYRPVQRIY